MQRGLTDGQLGADYYPRINAMCSNSIVQCTMLNMFEFHTDTPTNATWCTTQCTTHLCTTQPAMFYNALLSSTVLVCITILLWIAILLCNSILLCNAILLSIATMFSIAILLCISILLCIAILLCTAILNTSFHCYCASKKSTMPSSEHNTCRVSVWCQRR